MAVLYFDTANGTKGVGTTRPNSLTGYPACRKIAAVNSANLQPPIDQYKTSRFFPFTFYYCVVRRIQSQSHYLLTVSYHNVPNT
jgi:hypothetical protein